MKTRKQILFVLAAIIFTSCVKCKTCNTTLSSDQLSWNPYYPNEQIEFDSDNSDKRYFYFGDEERFTEDEICGNLDRPCQDQSGIKIFETDEFNLTSNYIGDITVFTTEDDYFAGILNIFDIQLYQDGLDSSLNVELADSIALLDSIKVHETWFTGCYEMFFDSSSTDTIENLTRFVYQTELGLLEFENQGGSNWYRKFEK